MVDRETMVREWARVREVVEAGAHFRETAGLNFRTIPDPFDSYASRLAAEDMVDFTGHPDPKPRPGIEVGAPCWLNQEMNRGVQQKIEGAGRWNQEFQGKVQGKDLVDAALASEKTEVLGRIANLRKEISEDDRLGRETLKTGHGVEERRVRAVPDEADSVELVDVSDEDLPAEKDLRLRKPERRGGLRSRNFDGVESRREREREKERERNPLDLVRGAHMDGDRREVPRSREEVPKSREEVSKPKQDVPRVKEVSKSREEVPRAREEMPRTREEVYREKRRPNDGTRERAEAHGRTRREEDRGRDKREEEKGRKRSRSRDRKRSRSRERKRSRERRRERSTSPYVLAMEQWTKFKKSESVMLAQLQKRREIFDKRPEDHPRYGDEWKLFWEKRYKELQVKYGHWSMVICPSPLG